MEADKKNIITSAELKPGELNQDLKIPSNIEAEQFVIGSILINNENINKVADFLLAEHFYEPLHQKIYESVVGLYDKGIIANAVTLKNQLQNDEALKEAGGANYFLRLTGLASGLINIRDYAQIIFNLYIRYIF